MSGSFQGQMLAEIPRLQCIALRLAGSRSEADDLVQEALLRAWRFRETFELGGNLGGWMSRILKNVFLTRRAEKRSWVQDVDGQYSGRIASGPDQEWRLRCAEVLRALPRLPADNRDALLLVTASGLSYQEAADAQGCDVNVLRSRVRRARVQLADLTGRDDPAGSPHTIHAGLH